jgi:hypothetical protein
MLPGLLHALMVKSKTTGMRISWGTDFHERLKHPVRQ